MNRNAKQLYSDSYLEDKIPEKQNNSSEKYRGVYVPTGVEIAFGKTQKGYDLSDEEAHQLLNGDEITILVTKKDGKKVKANVVLKEQSFTDKKTKKKVVYWGATVTKWLN